MKDIRMKAQVTVMAALITVLIMSLLCASIRSAVDTAVKVKAGMSANLAVESVFANYSRPLADRFNILLMPSSELMEAAIFKNAEQNCTGSSGFGGCEVQSVEITDTEVLTDAGGAPFAAAVIKYMQYGIFSEFSQMLLGHEKQLEKENKAGELINEITECEEDMVKTDSLILELIALVDGIDNEGGFLKCRDGQPAAVERAFVKQISPDGVYAQSVAVKDIRVFYAMKENYTDIRKLLEDIAEDANALDEANEDTKGNEIARLKGSLSSEISEFKNLADGSLDSCERAIDVCKKYIAVKNSIKDKAGKTQTNIEKSRDVIGTEIAEGLLEDIGRIKKFSTDDAICDAENMHTALRSIMPYFMSLQKYAHSMQECFDKDDYPEICRISDYADSSANSIIYDALVFDYSKVDFNASKANKNILTNMRKKLSKGVLGLVVEDTSQISDKEIQISDLADKMQNDAPSDYESLLTGLRNNILYNEYVLTNFTSYTDIKNTGGNDAAKELEILDYQVEYILNGCSSDYDNLFMTVMALSGIRECTNLLYLFTDSAKKEECYALSLALFGFTGMPTLVTIGKYVIMALWAYAESIIEIRQLLAGGRAEISKTSEDWNLSLSNLMAIKLETDKKNDDKAGKGLDYEQFLRILLFVEKGNYKYFRTMAQIELWMIKEGFSDFRMKNQLNGLCADVTFKIGGYGKGNLYKSSVCCSY